MGCDVSTTSDQIKDLPPKRHPSNPDDQRVSLAEYRALAPKKSPWDTT